MRGWCRARGAALVVELADRAGLTASLSDAMAVTGERRSARSAAGAAGRGNDAGGRRRLRDRHGRVRRSGAVVGARASEKTTRRALKSVDEKLLEQIPAARAAARSRVLDAGARPGTITLNIDATLITAHSNKEQAAGNYKHGYGFHPLGCWLDETGPGRTSITNRPRGSCSYRSAVAVSQVDEPLAPCDCPVSDEHEGKTWGLENRLAVARICVRIPVSAIGRVR